jgi:hypothetical protein
MPVVPVLKSYPRFGVKSNARVLYARHFLRHQSRGRDSKIGTGLHFWHGRTAALPREI